MLQVTAPLVALTIPFLLLPFAGHNRFFSMVVSAEWRRSAEARQIRLQYQVAVLLAGLATVAMAFAVQGRPKLAPLLPLVEVAGVAAAWNRGWRRTLPHREVSAVTRSARLREGPGRVASQIVGLLALLPIVATGVFLAARYQDLPRKIAVHFNRGGVPDHFVVRSWPVVLGPLLAGCAGVLLLMALLAWIERRGAGVADGGEYRALTRWMVAGVAWTVALHCAGMALLPAMQDPEVYANRLTVFSVACVFLLLLVSTGVLVRRRSVLLSGQNATDASHWKAGLFYFNPNDAALFVPKRMGFGWTLNMAQPAAWLVTALTLLVALLPALLRRG